MAPKTILELKPVLDGLGQGVLIFNSDGDLITENLAARNLLGKDFNLIHDKGWEAATTLFNARRSNPDEMLDAVRDQALESSRPVRFYVYLSGEYIPCSASAVQGADGSINLMITLETPDWTAVTNMVDRFRTEMKDAIESTQGHVDLIGQTIDHHQSGNGTEALGKRVSGFTRLISIHMHRVDRLMTMLERLEDIRTGRIREAVREKRRKLHLNNYLEDFVEELDEIMLVDPETEAQDQRSRLQVDIPSDVYVAASATYLTIILRDILRNAIMYSIKATPIKLKVQVKSKQIQFDLTDEGYGIREREQERVFEPFQRARQPQIIAEFGYGLSLYLCKYEVEAMNGRMWFESEEGVGTTISFMLPQWTDQESVSGSSSASTSSDSD